MTNEEMERAMQFILEQQARFASDIQQLKDVQASFQDVQASFQDVQASFQTQLGKLTDATLTLVGMVGQVVEAQARTDERLLETNERLNAFIDVVERYISGRNGGTN